MNSSSRQVLIVDGDARNVRVALEILEEAGVGVHVRTSGHTAVDAFLEIGPDLVLVGERLTGTHGADVSREIKGTKRGKMTPVVLMSDKSLDPSGQADILRASGCTMLLQKPLTRRDLLDALTVLLPNVFLGASISVDSPSDAERDASAEAGAHTQTLGAPSFEDEAALGALLDRVFPQNDSGDLAATLARRSSAGAAQLDASAEPPRAHAEPEAALASTAAEPAQAGAPVTAPIESRELLPALSPEPVLTLPQAPRLPTRTSSPVPPSPEPPAQVAASSEPLPATPEAGPGVAPASIESPARAPEQAPPSAPPAASPASPPETPAPQGPALSPPGAQASPSSATVVPPPSSFRDQRGRRGKRRHGREAEDRGPNPPPSTTAQAAAPPVSSTSMSSPATEPSRPASTPLPEAARVAAGARSEASASTLAVLDRAAETVAADRAAADRTRGRGRARRLGLVALAAVAALAAWLLLAGREDAPVTPVESIPTAGPEGLATELPSSPVVDEAPDLLPSPPSLLESAPSPLPVADATSAGAPPATEPSSPRPASAEAPLVSTATGPRSASAATGSRPAGPPPASSATAPAREASASTRRTPAVTPAARDAEPYPVVMLLGRPGARADVAPPTGSAEARPSDAPFAVDPQPFAPMSAVSRPLPEYPPAAVAARQSGTVRLLLKVEPTGRVSQVRVVRSAGLRLDRAAVAAAYGWTYRPADPKASGTGTWVEESVAFDVQTQRGREPAVKR